MASSVELGPGSRLVAPTRSRNCCSETQRRRPTTSVCMRAMWAAGPPKPIVPSLRNNPATSPRPPPWGWVSPSSVLAMPAMLADQPPADADHHPNNWSTGGSGTAEDPPQQLGELAGSPGDRVVVAGGGHRADAELLGQGVAGLPGDLVRGRRRADHDHDPGRAGPEPGDVGRPAEE